MLNWMIYTPVSTIMLGFSCLRVFADFNLVNPKHDGRMMILRPYGSKKISKMAQSHLTRTNRGQNHDLGGSWKKL